MQKNWISLLALVAASIALVPANAATTHAVDVLDSRFEPAVVQAAPGDTIEWTWRGGGRHNVTAYRGATFSHPTTMVGTFDWTFGGGTASYRCTLHSLLDQEGRCSGMCGVITEDATPPAAPVIDEPAAAAIVRSPVRITGSAPGAEHVVVSENGVQRAAAPVGVNGSWAVQLTMSDGEHTISVVARNLIGIDGPAATRSFTVDATPPTVEITDPADLSLRPAPLVVSGIASDERVLAGVSVAVANALTGAPVASMQAGSAASWSVSFDVGPGVYAITATARDAAGNATASAPVRVLVL